jgi:muramoyltetrapeptide carboxypeptidase
MKTRSLDPPLFYDPPPALGPGARVAVVAPSSPFDREAFEEGVSRLRERYEVTYDPGILSRKGFLAGDDDRRARELLAALESPGVAAILAARGGYGATRLLPLIDRAVVARAHRLLVGFSDITALHAVWARAGVRSIHASMVAALGREDPARLRSLVEVMEGAIPPPFTGLQTLAPGVAVGPLVGGNLAVLAAMLGTAHFPPIEQSILFLEDVDEHPYRVDRMLTSLRQSKKLLAVAGIALGRFDHCRPRAEDGVRVEEVLRERLAHLGVPVVAGIEAGHEGENREILLGTPVRLDADRGRLEVLEPVVRRA